MAWMPRHLQSRPQSLGGRHTDPPSSLRRNTRLAHASSEPGSVTSLPCAAHASHGGARPREPGTCNEMQQEKVATFMIVSIFCFSERTRSPVLIATHRDTRPLLGAQAKGLASNLSFKQPTTTKEVFLRGTRPSIRPMSNHHSSASKPYAANHRTTTAQRSRTKQHSMLVDQTWIKSDQRRRRRHRRHCCHCRRRRRHCCRRRRHCCRRRRERVNQFTSVVN